jgi:hypothetical protein
VDRDFCEIKCGRCRIRSKFCIVKDAKNKRATCCHEDEQCCQDTMLCCPVESTCCPPNPAGVGCCANGRTCCPSDLATGCCRQHQTCCPGAGCVDKSSDDAHCGGCGIACAADESCVDGTCRPQCPAGLTLCGSRCVDTMEDPQNCGGCGNFNPNGLKCCFGVPCHYTNGVCCQSPGARGTCYPDPPC